MPHPTSEFEFVRFENPSGSRWGHHDYCLRLRDVESNRHADLMYTVGQDNFVVISDGAFSKPKSDRLVIAAFCYLSVIVK